jgi:hypothetical protein
LLVAPNLATSTTCGETSAVTVLAQELGVAATGGVCADTGLESDAAKARDALITAALVASHGGIAAITLLLGFALRSVENRRRSEVRHLLRGRAAKR